MGFADLDVTYIQRISTLPGGAHVEFGAFSDTNSRSHTVPTTLKNLICGLACSSMGGGNAKSITGANIDFSMATSTERLNYIVFGW